MDTVLEHSDESLQAELARIPEELPLLPIRNEVCFPGTIMPLTVARDKSRLLVEAALTGDKLIGVVAQRHAKTEDPTLDDLYRVGTVAHIVKLIRMPDQSETLVVRGMVRFGIENLTTIDPYWRGRVHIRPDHSPVTTEIEALMLNVRQVADDIIERSQNVPEEAQLMLNSIAEPGPLADFLAANLSLGLVHKQEFLETFDVVSRLVKVNTALAAQLDLLQLSEKLQNQVKGQIDKSNREYYLREQLKAIRTELGMDKGYSSELRKLEEKLRAAHLPVEVDSEAQRELERLSNISEASPEYSVTLDYLYWIAALPWAVSTVDELDLDRAAAVLDADHYGLEKVKKRILEFLAVHQLNPQGKGPILCLAGPPGVGKTSLGQSIARALNRKFIRMSLGGTRDEADIRGHRRTYIGAIPGRILQELRKAGANNPVFMLDEVDKIGQDFRGDPAAALLEVLDPQQNFSFTDHYLGVPFDLSQVMFICTANDMESIIPALQDRMEVIYLNGYTAAEKLVIARQYLVPRQLRETGLSSRTIKFTDPALRKIIESYTREAGVRQLERQIGAICRAAAALYLRKKSKQFSIKPVELDDYLGPPRHESEVALRTSKPGVVTALAYTPVGGELLFVEATRMPGDGNLILTGQVGSVMKESAHAGFSLIRSRGADFGISEEQLSQTDIHIHVPAGAIPKDGPSAGVAMFLAMVSILTGKVVRPDIALTGEITLRGLVLPVGGIKDKILAAHRAGIARILLPKRNEIDLLELPADVRRELKFIPMSDIDEALSEAFLPFVKTRTKKNQQKLSKRK
ncbi:MAG: Lon protease 2 [Phycisphaerae bacterium]|nr:Lon protease 2 [Phycisphaerae bacterium]